MSFINELKSFNLLIQECEDSLRKLEKMSKIVTQHVETAVFVNCDKEEMH
ncbi:hypothetical protein TUBRATIS_11200 [Tubulinosema ratisbonensis]|uniref:Uncharacterized protein n=1 Tax=Tubulinosema ratisbonensis TaxID=291195 RepID=A0A437AMJ7_9MICR|nr:hypothetical protein TUBRATIS_11200 [Tubulinosema ratisbonensis]